MLTTSHKASILAKAGVQVPPAPVDPQQDDAVKRWSRTVESLYVEYAAARAAKSLRDSEDADRLERLRRANRSS